MAAQKQPDYDTLVWQLETYLSEPRMRRYLLKTSFRSEKALKLYIWNAQMGEAFHTSIQASEVAFRNRINAALIETFGDEWWSKEKFLKLTDHQRNEDLNTAFNRLSNLGKNKTTDQIVANLSFGFWVGLLAGRYNPDIWSAKLKTAFPHLPEGIKRTDVHMRAKQIADLRNRISHHEPIFDRTLSDEHSQIMDFLRWMSPEKAKWIASSCRVQQVLRLKP